MNLYEKICSFTLEEMAKFIEELTPATRTMFILDPKNDGKEYRDYVKEQLEKEITENESISE